MKFLKQFGIILLISFMGEAIKYFVPLPIPASIYGLVIMFIALKTHILKLESVNSTGKFLIEIMPLMFIPSAVGLINSWGVLQPVFIPVITITVVSTVVVMAVTGRITQAVIRIQKTLKHKKEANTK
ncbi:MAG: CidA/LrgA family protein [Clostridia bacterium]|nr:CidA/LrgA family protein [Clostridia bacterium]